jgi:MFS family permease
MSFHGRARFVILAALSLLYFLLMAGTFNSLGQVLPFMVADLRMNWTEAGFGFTLLGASCGAASMAPALTIRWGGVTLTLLIGTALLIGGFAAMATAHGVLAYEMGAVLLGLGFCFCGTVPSVHIISSIFAKRSTALGIYFTTGNVGAVAGPLFFYAVSEIWSGWRVYWLACAVAALLVGSFAALVTRGGGRGKAPEAEPSAAPADAARWTMKAALATPQFWMVVLAYTGCLLVNTTAHSFAFQHLLEHGQSKASATALVSLAALVSAISAGVAGVAGERIHARWLTLLSLGALVVASVALALAQGWLVLTAFAIGMGIGLGFSVVSTALLLQDYFGRGVSLELYSIMTAFSTSAAFGPGIGGMVRDRSGTFSPVFWALAIIDVVLMLGVLVMRRPIPGAAAEEGPHPADPLAVQG